jgi:hypothetical protein
MLQGGSFLATGVIEPSRFVSLDTTAGNLNSVIQSVSNDARIVGISQEGTEDAPGVGNAQPDAARPGNLSAPVNTNFTLGQTAAGALAATIYYVKITWVTIFGETTPSTEQNFSASVNNVLTVTPGGTIPIGALGYNVYVGNTAGGGSGTETKQNTVLLSTTQVWTEPTSGLITGVIPPILNSSGFPATKTSLKVYGLGDICQLRIGAGGCTAGDFLSPDANGQGITTSLSQTTVQYYGARALVTANAGELAPVQVLIGGITGT